MNDRSDSSPSDGGEADVSQPPIADYALLSDCHSVSLVDRTGSIDWYCMPRIDSPAVFARLLDATRGGRCILATDEPDPMIERRYLPRTMVLETTHRTATGVLRVRDCLAMRSGGRVDPHRQLIRLAECTDGDVTVFAEMAARFDFGMIPPWIRSHGDGRFSAVGGSGGLGVWSDIGLEICDHHDLRGRRRLRSGERAAFVLTSSPPELLDDGPDEVDHQLVERRLEATIEWWNDWCDHREGGHDGLSDSELRSALALKSLQHAPTGAIAAAATTSLPEIPDGSWNWDYRFSWTRDSWMTVRSLSEAGFQQEADRFHRFVERSAAGSASELRVLYGVDGRHRTPELVLDEVSGYRGAQPVRVGNAAQEQLQLDMFGYLLELSWWRAQEPAELESSFWSFVVGLVDVVCRRWQEPDHGIWELRGEPQQFVYSKVLCWVAIDRGLSLADHLGRTDEVDVDRWSSTRDAIRGAIESDGVRDGRFVATMGHDDVDASLLLIPEFGFVDPDADVMAATVDAVIDQLDDGGLIRRFPVADDGTEGTFVACTFWLVERLVDLGRHEQARGYFRRGAATSNDVGLFAEEYEPRGERLLGNFPQALSHLAHLGAALAMARGSGVD